MIQSLLKTKNLPFEDELISILGGHIFFQTLNSAVKFKIFDLLEKARGLSLKQIALQLNIQERPARILLLGLTSLKLLHRVRAIYSNTSLAQRYFTTDSPENLIAVLAWQAEINYDALGHLHESMVTGENKGLQVFEGDAPTLYERLELQPHKEQIFQDAMEDISKQANKDLAEYVDFSHTNHLVDVGGGNASNIINLVNNYPSLKATVFDRQTVCDIAQQNIKDNKLSHQCTTVNGDCFKDEFPRNADAIIFCHFLTIWSDEKNLFLLKKAFEALPKGGKVYIFNMMQHNSEDGPLTSAMGSPYFLSLATSEGMLYTWKEYQHWLIEAGFSNLETIVLPKDHGVIIGEKV